MNETILEPIVNEIDDMLTSMIEKHSIEPFALTAVVLARLVLMNDYMGSGDVFRELMKKPPTANNMDEVLH